tara:strand:+ start:1305 stop:1586 length:282 start_codon:yes stop_codon:yes gene_type:complete
MKLTKTNCKVKIKTGQDFKIFKAIIEGQNPNGISILHPDAVLLKGNDEFEHLDDFFKSNPDWRDNASFQVKIGEGGKQKSFIQIHTELSDTEY